MSVCLRVRARARACACKYSPFALSGVATNVGREQICGHKENRMGGSPFALYPYPWISSSRVFGVRHPQTHEHTHITPIDTEAQYTKHNAAPKHKPSCLENIILLNTPTKTILSSSRSLQEEERFRSLSGPYSSPVPSPHSLTLHEVDASTTCQCVSVVLLVSASLCGFWDPPHLVGRHCSYVVARRLWSLEGLLSSRSR